MFNFLIRIIDNLFITHHMCVCVTWPELSPMAVQFYCHMSLVSITWPVKLITTFKDANKRTQKNLSTWNTGCFSILLILIVLKYREKRNIQKVAIFRKFSAADGCANQKIATIFYKILIQPLPIIKRGFPENYSQISQKMRMQRKKLSRPCCYIQLNPWWPVFWWICIWTTAVWTMVRLNYCSFELLTWRHIL